MSPTERSLSNRVPSRVPSRSERGYDRIAFAYHVIERIVFGGHLQAGRVALLGELPQWQTMLILGDGDGRLLETIVDRIPNGSDRVIVSVDHSQAMLDRQKQRLSQKSGCSKIQWIQTDALLFGPDPGAFDVIVTPFFLDCFTESQLQIGLPQWISGLRPDGRWYHVDFVIPEKRWNRLVAIGLTRVMHWFFQITTGLCNRKLIDVPEHLLQLGMRRVHHADRFGGMISTEIYERMSAVESA